MDEITTDRFFRETFIVRLWRQKSAPSGWGAEVQHVSTGEVTIVRSLDELLAYFQNQLDEETAFLAGDRSGLK